MLPKKLRLSRQTTKQVVIKGKKIFQFPFELRYLPNTEKVSCWSIKITKKSNPLATTRNRLKRLIREALVKITKNTNYSINGVVRLNNKLDKPSLKNIELQLNNLIKKTN